MGLRDELTEPWGILLGATAGGVAWAAASLSLPVAAGVGLAVWATKAVVATLERRAARPAPTGQRLPVDARAPEGRWLARARRAATSFADLAKGMTAGPLAERVASMRPEVDDTVATLERLAGQATAAGRALALVDATALGVEANRLAAQRAHASGDIAEQLERSLASVKAQQEVHDRLAKAREGVLARLESGTLGLESLVARLVELSALATGGPAGELAGIDEVSDELEGIRQGLAETEEVSRQALSAYQRTRK
jgi:hypothetical protein